MKRMHDDIKALRADLTPILSDHEDRMRVIEKTQSQMTHIQDMLIDHEERLRCVESDTHEIKVSQKTTTGMLAALQIAVGAVAAWLGMRQ